MTDIQLEHERALKLLDQLAVTLLQFEYANPNGAVTTVRQAVQRNLDQIEMLIRDHGSQDLHAKPRRSIVDEALLRIADSLYGEDHSVQYWRHIVLLCGTAFMDGYNVQGALGETGPGPGGRWRNGCTSPYGHRWGQARCTHCGDPRRLEMGPELKREIRR